MAVTIKNGTEATITGTLTLADLKKMKTGLKTQGDNTIIFEGDVSLSPDVSKSVIDLGGGVDTVHFRNSGISFKEDKNVPVENMLRFNTPDDTSILFANTERWTAVE